MSFKSILFTDNQSMASQNNLPAPDYFPDLYLDQVIESITAPKKDYDLKPFFYSVLQDSHSIRCRQAVYRDLENPALFDMVNRFAQKMVIARRYLEMIKHLYYHYHKESWYLEAALVSCDAFSGFSCLVHAIFIEIDIVPSAEAFNAVPFRLSVTHQKDCGFHRLIKIGVERKLTQPRNI